MIHVNVIDNKIEWALKKFKKKVKESGLLHELQERQFYVKPSLKRRKEKMRARLRAQLKSKKATL